MIAILDCGMGNPGSINNMIRKAGGKAEVTSDARMVARADALVLPGVGAFDNGMHKLTNSGLLEILTEKVMDKGVPLLAICIGMQLLFEVSEEGQSAGLGWIKGSVVRFDFSKHDAQARLKIPHMGWNLVDPVNHDTLFKGLEHEARFYFVHSYHVVCKDPSDVLATSDYGGPFTCAVKKGNIFGTQFHPEKSHRFGLTLFRNFLEYANC